MKSQNVKLMATRNLPQHLLFLLYSLIGICYKFIAAEPSFFTYKAMILFAIIFVIMGVYAIVWQQILKVVALNVAYCSKSVTIIWGMLWGATIFAERITVTNILGAILVFVGIILVVGDNG